MKPEWQHSPECMCSQRNIATKKVWLPDRHKDRQTNARQNYSYVPLCFAGDIKTLIMELCVLGVRKQFWQMNFIFLTVTCSKLLLHYKNMGTGIIVHICRTDPGDKEWGDGVRFLTIVVWESGIFIQSRIIIWAEPTALRMVSQKALPVDCCSFNVNIPHPWRKLLIHFREKILTVTVVNFHKMHYFTCYC